MKQGSSSVQKDPALPGASKGFQQVNEYHTCKSNLKLMTLLAGRDTILSILGASDLHQVLQAASDW